MPDVSLSIFGGVGAQFFDNNGVPLVGGKIYTYQAGTSTPLATYTSSSGAAAHTNPIVLDAGGRVPGGEIWNQLQLYKFVLKTSAEVTIATYDDIVGVNSVNAENVAYDPPFTGGVATNVEESLAQIISVTNFGAVGDGITNDTAAFAAARSITNRYYIPAGVYVLDASPDPFLDCYTSGNGVTLVIGGTSYNCSNAFAGPLRYVAASATKTNITHSKTNNVIQYWQDGSPGTATGFYRGLAFTTDSHWVQAQPSTNGGSTDILWQRSTLNADPGGNRFNETFEESTDRLIFSYATTASGAPSFNSYMRVVAGLSPILEFPSLQPRFSQGWKVTTPADGNFVFVATPASDRVYLQKAGGAITHMTFKDDGAVGFFGAGGITRPTVSGSRGGNAALASLITSLAQLGLITDSTTA